MKHKIKRYNIPIYFGRLVIAFTNDFNGFYKKYGTGGDFNLDKFGAYTYVKGQDYYMVFDTKPTHSLIAHESVHTVNFIFNETHITLDVINDEPQAYLAGWVTGKVYKAKKHFKL